MDPANTTYRVHQCSKCPGDTEYYCESCRCDLCFQCRDNHVKNLKTAVHNAAIYRDMLNSIPKQEMCARHNNTYRTYCEPCQIPLCDSCFGHKSHRFPVFLCGQSKHKILSLESYKTKQQHKGTIHIIRSDALFYRHVLLPRIIDDIKTCHRKFSLYQSEMLTKTQSLEDLIDDMLYDLLNNVLCDFDFKHRCLKQKIEMRRHLARLQRYVHLYEHSAIHPLRFLLSIKTALPQIHLTLHTNQISMTESLNKEDVIESMSAIRITERGNRHVGNEYLLKMMFGAWLRQSFIVTGVDCCHHISCVTSDRVWVSDEDNLILTNTLGVSLHRVKGLRSSFIIGSHTVNSESELIYIDRNYNINKLSKDIKTTTTLIDRPDPMWEPRCVYCSPSTGNLLVGMYRENALLTKKGKLVRYNQGGQLTQTIQHNNKGQGLYRKPNYITENNNGDVVVSDYDAVVVTERGGRHSFTYTGHPSGSGLLPRGICTDALSHILVCANRTRTVHMLDKNGKFMSHLLTISQEMGVPYSLSYDVNTHRLFVGSRSWYNNKVCAYRYITSQGALRDEDTPHTCGDVLSSSTPAVKWQKSCKWFCTIVLCSQNYTIHVVCDFAQHLQMRLTCI